MARGGMRGHEREKGSEIDGKELRLREREKSGTVAIKGNENEDVGGRR